MTSAVSRHDASIDDDVTGKSIAISTFTHQRPTSSSSISPLIFAHGASGSMHTPAVLFFANGVARARDVITFQGNMNMKARVEAFAAVARHSADVRAKQSFVKRNEEVVVLGGRSMGSRAAILAANELKVGVDASAETEVPIAKCFVLVSYPLVAPSGDVRDQLLLDLDAEHEVLFMIGSRDTMCPLDHLEEIRRKMTAKSWLVRLQGADHGMNVKPNSAVEALVEESGRVAALWLSERNVTRRESIISVEVDGDGLEARWSRWCDKMPEIATEDMHDAQELERRQESKAKTEITKKQKPRRSKRKQEDEESNNQEENKRKIKTSKKRKQTAAETISNTSSSSKRVRARASGEIKALTGVASRTRSRK
jgi:predicted alpha/beta-hydrolase family hydrolase